MKARLRGNMPIIVIVSLALLMFVFIPNGIERWTGDNPKKQTTKIITLSNGETLERTTMEDRGKVVYCYRRNTFHNSYTCDFDHPIETTTTTTEVQK